MSTTQFQSRGPNNFAAPTVLSRIREKPPVERQEKEVYPTKVETVRQTVASPGKEKDEKLVRLFFFNFSYVKVSKAGIAPCTVIIRKGVAISI